MERNLRVTILLDEKLLNDPSHCEFVGKVFSETARREFVTEHFRRAGLEQPKRRAALYLDGFRGDEVENMLAIANETSSGN